jgi:hypothetical protein
VVETEAETKVIEVVVETLVILGADVVATISLSFPILGTIGITLLGKRLRGQLIGRMWYR